MNGGIVTDPVTIQDLEFTIDWSNSSNVYVELDGHDVIHIEIYSDPDGRPTELYVEVWNQTGTGNELEENPPAGAPALSFAFQGRIPITHLDAVEEDA